MARYTANLLNSKVHTVYDALSASDAALAFASMQPADLAGWIIVKGRRSELKQFRLKDSQAFDGDSPILDCSGVVTIVKETKSAEGRSGIERKKLKGHEYAISAIPLLLVFIGGALGGAIGGGAFGLNCAIFSSRKPPVIKFGLSALVTLVAFGLFIVVAGQLIGMFGEG